MKKSKRQPKRIDTVVLLKDLAPRKDVTGGAEKVLFGQGLEPDASSPVSMTPEARGGNRGTLRKNA